MFSNLKVRYQILMAFLTISLASSLLFLYFGYQVQRHTLIESIDQRLTIAALSLEYVFPPEYVDRVIRKEPFSESEQVKIAARWIELRDNTASDYLYIVYQDQDTKKYFFAIDSTHASDVIPSLNINKEYPIIWPGIKECLDTGSTIYDEGADEFSNARSAYIRHRSPDGHDYCLCADINMDQVHEVKRKAIQTFLALAIASFLATALVGIFLSRIISEPVRQLSQFTTALGQSNFSPEVVLPKEMAFFASHSKNEFAVLISDIDKMRLELLAHVAKTEQLAKEKERAESDLRIAGEIQQSYLPHILEKAGNLDLFASVTPSRHAGGDLYDYIALDESNVFFALGDVSGKGVPAALFMTMVLTLLRAGRTREHSLAALMKWVNDTLARNNPDGTFVTLFIGIINVHTGAVTYCNGGHNPPVLYRADGSASWLEHAANPLVGVFPDIEFESREIVLEINDRLIIYSDGVTEAMAADDSFFGEDRLLKVVQELDRSQTSEDAVGTIFDSVVHFASGRSQSDDISILCCHRVG